MVFILLEPAIVKEKEDIFISAVWTSYSVNSMHSFLGWGVKFDEGKFLLTPELIRNPSLGCKNVVTLASTNTL